MTNPRTRAELRTLKAAPRKSLHGMHGLSRFFGGENFLGRSYVAFLYISTKTHATLTTRAESLIPTVSGIDQPVQNPLTTRAAPVLPSERRLIR